VKVFAVILAALVIPFAAACGGDEDGADTGAATGGGEDTAAQTVAVSATEFAFEPSDITVEPGSASFELTNDGEFPHALEIEGNGVELASDTIDAGASTTLEAELEEGTYEIYCPVGDHRDRGMVGTLTVGSGGAGGTGTSTDESETGGDTGGDTGETETSGGDDDSSGSGGAGGY
jgi:plastocyanin